MKMRDIMNVVAEAKMTALPDVAKAIRALFDAFEKAGYTERHEQVQPHVRPNDQTRRFAALVNWGDWSHNSRGEYRLSKVSHKTASQIVATVQAQFPTITLGFELWEDEKVINLYASEKKGDNYHNYTWPPRDNIIHSDTDASLRSFRPNPNENWFGSRTFGKTPN